MAPSPRPTTCARSIPSASSRRRSSATRSAIVAGAVGRLRAPVGDDAVVAAEVAQLPSVDDLDMREDRDVEDRLALPVVVDLGLEALDPAQAGVEELPIRVPLLVGHERPARRSRTGLRSPRRASGPRASPASARWSRRPRSGSAAATRKKSRRSALISSAWVYVMKRPPSSSTVKPWQFGSRPASSSISATGASGSSSRLMSRVGIRSVSRPVAHLVAARHGKHRVLVDAHLIGDVIHHVADEVRRERASARRGLDDHGADHLVRDHALHGQVLDERVEDALVEPVRRHPIARPEADRGQRDAAVGMLAAEVEASGRLRRPARRRVPARSRGGRGEHASRRRAQRRRPACRRSRCARRGRRGWCRQRPATASRTRPRGPG